MKLQLPLALRSSPYLKFALLAAILASHLVPSIVIGFGYVIPGSCIDGINPLTLGYIACLAGFVPTYFFGVLTSWQLGKASAERPSPA